MAHLFDLVLPFEVEENGKRVEHKYELELWVFIGGSDRRSFVGICVIFKLIFYLDNRVFWLLLF